MKKVVALLFFLVAFTALHSQSKTELGLFGGGSLMQGDINADQYFKDPSYALGILFRYNLTQRYALRAQLNYTNLKALDTHSSDAYRINRNASFNTSIMDAAVLFEINFLQFKYSERYTTFSPYINAGIGMHFVGVPFGLTIPMGVGIKKTIGRRWCVGVEYTFRKTFNDQMDGIQNIGQSSSVFNNNDWYTMAGFVITYKIFDEITDCPAYDNKKH